MQMIINSLVPIFAVIGLGIVLRKNGFLNAAATQSFNRFAYYLGLPLFLFYKLGNAAGSTDGLANRYSVILLLATIAAMLIGWLVANLAGIGFSSRGAFVQACLRGNLAFMGLPLVSFVIYDLPAEQKLPIETAMLLALAPVIIFYNVASVSLLAIYNKQTEARFSWISVVKSIVTNPILLGCLAGILFQKTGLQIPTAISRICQVMGASAFPMALVGIGSQLATISIAGRLFAPALATAIKCVVGPLAAWIIATLLGMDGAQRQVIVILAAMPTAVSSYVLAEQMEADPDLAASSVVISTAFSLVTLVVLLWIL